MENNIENTTQETNVVEQETQETQGAPETQKVEIDYSKLEEIVEKGKAQKENAIINSFLQQMGLSQDEIKEAANIFRENKEREEKERLSNTENLTKELESLKSQLGKAQLDNIINQSSYELGLDAKTVKAIQRLGDFSQVQTYGKIDSEKVKGVINSVLEEYPMLKTTKTEEAPKENKRIDVGSPDSNINNKTSDDEYRKLWGLPPKEVK